jgi:sulfur-oxidizing protein SoxX
MSNPTTVSNTVFWSLAVAFTVALPGCTPKPASGHGFTLPAGDAEQGKVVFMTHNCHQCHRISGVEPPPEDEREMNIMLGGEVRRISTYGELVTSVINPSHKLARGYAEEATTEDGESKMTNYNDVLTVSELIDLVAYLQSKYSIRPPQVTDYPMYF